jgi:hypothetical protein
VELLGENLLKRIYLYLERNDKIPPQTFQPRVAIEHFIEIAVTKHLKEKQEKEIKKWREKNHEREKNEGA